MSDFNLFEELGATGGAFPQYRQHTRDTVPTASRDDLEDRPPSVIFGDPTPNNDPVDLTLKAHKMDLRYVDERVKDPKVREWMEQRRLGVGASEIAVLFGLSPWSTLEELWDEKVNGCDYSPGSELFHFGHEFEPLIAAEFASRTGEEVAHPPSEIMVGEKPYFRASLDRVVVENGKPVAALELKNLNESRHAEYRVAGPSIGYLLQLQYQMMVAKLDYGYLAVMFGGQKFVAWQVNANPAVQEEIARRVEEFWGYVERKEMPPERLGLRNLTAADSSHVLEMTSPPWENRLVEYQDLKLQKAKIEKQEKILREQLKEHIGNYQTARAGKMVASVSISKRKAVDMKGLREDHPDLIEQYTKESEVKTMRVKERK